MKSVQELRVKNRLAAYTIACCDLGLYGASFLLIINAENILLALLGSVANGLFIALLFVVGHDCCHQSFLPVRTENEILGRMMFLPSLTPFSLWDIGHNKTHHRFTNLKGEDYVFAPVTLDEYRNMSPRGRWRYRFFRSFFGHFWYYPFEIWAPKMIFVRKNSIGCPVSSLNLRDIALVAIYLVVVSTISVVSKGFNGLVMAVVIPFLIWSVLMSAVIFLHHTNPALRWYNNRHKWNFRDAQKNCAVHVIFPPGINFIFHGIMEHNAHHMQPGVPLYHVREAQSTLAADAVKFTWSLRAHMDLTRLCKFYDFDAHCWVALDGRKTSLQDKGMESNG